MTTPLTTRRKPAARKVATQLQQDGVSNNSGKNIYRRASPMARMRDDAMQKSALIDVDAHGSPFKMAVKREPKTDKEMRQEKSRKWKKKMKIAQAKKHQERRALDDNYTVTSSQFASGNPVLSCVLENVEGTDLFKRLTQCGGGIGDDGAASEYEEYSEYGSSVGISDYGSSVDTRSDYGSSVGNTGKFYDDDDAGEEEESALSASVSRRNGKQRRQQQRRGVLQKKEKPPPFSESSCIDGSSIGPSVDTTVLEEMTASFISTDEETAIAYGEQSERSEYILQQQPNSTTNIIPVSEASLATTVATSELEVSNTTDYAIITGTNNDISSENNNSNNNNRARGPSSTGVVSCTQPVVRAPCVATSSTIDRHLPSGSNTKLRHNPTINLQSDFSFVKTFTEDIKNGGESMLWHQETSATNPSNVIIRLKKGYRFTDGRYCAPRLIWTDHRKDQNYGLDIFDIQSLERADIVQLETFPYAMPKRSVCLHLKNTTSFIFEAGTEEDAIRFVRGVRSVVVRLAYNLVVGNLDKSCELLELSPKSTLMEFDWSRAMDDVTEHLVEKTLQSTMI